MRAPAVLQGQCTPLSDVVNLKYVASQLLHTLVGSFGLVAAAPLSAVFASVLHTRGQSAQAADARLSQNPL
ncbi:MAG: YibE/F family protein [Eubacteriales bacterium]|nr:YibE/F family protein [Eubacteriales bacterium]